MAGIDRVWHDPDTPIDVDARYGRAIGVFHTDTGMICFPCHTATYTDEGIDPDDGHFFAFDWEPGMNRERCGVCLEPLHAKAEEWYRTHDRAPADLL